MDTNDIIDLIRNSKLEELDKKEFKKLYKTYLSCENPRIVPMNASLPYKEYKGYSIKQLQTLLKKDLNSDQKQRIHQEITYRILSNELYQILQHISDFTFKEDELTCSPFDKYDLEDIISIFISSNYSELSDKQKRFALQSLHNTLCRQNNAQPIDVDYYLSQEELLDHTFMNYCFDVFSLSSYISVPNSDCIEKNTTGIDKMRAKWGLMSLADIIHETSHHITISNYFTKSNDSIEKFISSHAIRHYIFPSTLFEYQMYEYLKDVDELNARIFTVKILDNWKKQNILPKKIETDVMMLYASSLCYHHFQDIGETWEDIKKQLTAHILVETNYFRSFHPLFREFDEKHDPLKTLPLYFAQLKKDYLFIRKMYHTYLLRVLQYFNDYCSKHPKVHAYLDKYIDIDTLQKHTTRNRVTQSCSVNTNILFEDNIEDLMFGVWQCMEADKRKNNKHDIIKEYFEERNRRIKAAQEEREDA